MTNLLRSFFIKPLSAILLLAATTTLLVGCYRMPGEDDYSLVPTTNNPDVTRDRGSGLVPGGNF